MKNEGARHVMRRVHCRLFSFFSCYSAEAAAASPDEGQGFPSLSLSLSLSLSYDACA